MYLVQGVYLVWGAVPGPGGVYLVPEGVPGPGGVCLVRGVPGPGGVPGQVLPPREQNDKQV